MRLKSQTFDFYSGRKCRCDSTQNIVSLHLGQHEALQVTVWGNLVAYHLRYCAAMLHYSTRILA
jgi:hypothetical protein